MFIFPKNHHGGSTRINFRTHSFHHILKWSTQNSKSIAAGCSAAVGFAGCCGLADCRAKEWAAVMRSRWLWPVTGLSAWWYTSGHVGGSGHGLRLRRWLLLAAIDSLLFSFCMAYILRVCIIRFYFCKWWHYRFPSISLTNNIAMILTWLTVLYPFYPYLSVVSSLFLKAHLWSQYDRLMWFIFCPVYQLRYLLFSAPNALEGNLNKPPVEAGQGK